VERRSAPDAARRARPTIPLARRVAVAAVVFAALGGGVAGAATVRATLASGDRAALVDHSQIFLEAKPQPGEGLLSFCRRLTGSTAGCAEIARLNRNPRRLLAGVSYRVPYRLLAPDLQLSALHALYPDDRAAPEGWTHHSRGDDLGPVAEWLTGDAANAAAIRKADGRKSDRLSAGDEVRVPHDLLLPIFRVEAPPAPPPAAAAAAPAGTEEPPPLEYGEDGRGKYALYRLHGGEALYSAVVVRFTGRLHAEDVNALAAEIARRSDIADVTDIPIGYPIKIPFDVLLPEFLPPGDPRRLEWEVERALADQYKNPVQAHALDGVTVILDAGHGGADVGASKAGVWESSYVYDIMLRVKRRLETKTLARVETTTRDGKSYVIVDRDVLPYSRGHVVLTDPPYPIVDSVVGVHLRWYLANSLFRHLTAHGDPAKVIFLSVHADSLHPSLRGATAYVPDAAGTAGSFGKSGSVFEKRQEYREQRRVSFPLATRQKSEGLSRELAGKIIDSFRSNRLDVHPFQPVRDRIYRGHRSWVPAVLRYNAIPAKMLLEVCNLANVEDRKLLQTREYRERVADAVVDGILAYFGEKPL
jgi:N-acetylmuramoyl-L-alanine amidase